jgi:putative membrane-bound dehydrogenase-like protein
MRPPALAATAVPVLLAGLMLACFAAADPGKSFVPRRQAGPPGEPLEPAEAARRMTVPPGFAVQLFAAEPDLVNPVAMTFDERGHVWVAESLEYPRRDPGPGRDRIRVLADTDGDGRADRATTFLDGLNIPSGIAVGHGGAWVAAAPDLLFVQDTDGDGAADRREVVVTGFGRLDTHELPNSLTWGPDGWLYGLNGVFNGSHVHYAPGNPNHRPDHPGWKFDCCLFRVHPRTREFEVVCRGTSNPWGIAFNDEGDSFVSACVIDHLWHLVEGGFYHRQAGPQPPEAWKLESIVAHKHQQAAYCGITWFDSDTYPEAYRRRLFMGNVHGGCINVDRIERAGSTYRGLPDPDFLTANDVWFMPVVQKTGPDGCLWVLDWYDRYHCYQDANADPAGVDRLRGRLYRVTYQGTPACKPFDLGDHDDERLLDLLGHPNVWMRETAQRLIGERSRPETVRALLARLQEAGDRFPPVQVRHMAFALAGCDLRSLPDLHAEAVRTLSTHADPFRRGWALRLARQPGSGTVVDRDLLVRGLADEAAPVRLQAAIAVGNAALGAGDGLPLAELAGPLARSILAAPDDLHHARFVWRGLQAIAERAGGDSAAYRLPAEVATAPAGASLADRILEGQLSRGEPDAAMLAARLTDELATPGPCPLLDRLVVEVREGRLAERRLATIGPALRPVCSAAADRPDDARFGKSLVVAATCGDPVAAAALVERAWADRSLRIPALAALVASRSPEVRPFAARILAPTTRASTLREALAVLARSDDPGVWPVVIEALPGLPPALRSQAVDLLTQRAGAARALLEAVAAGRVEAPVLDANQLRRLVALGDPGIDAIVRDRWGTVREGRNPDRERVVDEMRTLATTMKGDPTRGEAVFTRVCASCHRLHGVGAEVGPDITANGRASFDQLLSNLFDPSLVIGAAYQSWTVVTDEGRAITGLLAEDGPDRIVLKVPGGAAETIPRSAIDVLRRNETSLMPEGLERQCSREELADLLAYLSLDRPPNDPEARPIPGAPGH